MNDDLKGWKMLLVCILLLFPSLVLGLFLIHMIESMTGSTLLGYVIGFLVAGVGPAVPIIISAYKSKKMKGIVKYIVIIAAVFLFMCGIFIMTKTPDSQIEEFQKRQQEWQQQKSKEMNKTVSAELGETISVKDLVSMENYVSATISPEVILFTSFSDAEVRDDGQSVYLGYTRCSFDVIVYVTDEDGKVTEERVSIVPVIKD